jgi:hypothetical protein
MSPVWIYLILAFVIAAFVIAIIAVVQSNNNKDDIKNLQNQSVNYSALPTGKTTLVSPNITSVETTIYSIDVPLTNWEFSSQNIGILGNLYSAIIFDAGTTSLATSVYYSKNGGAEIVLDGAVDFIPVSTGPYPVNINLNGVTTTTTFSKGDTLTLFVKMAAAGGAASGTATLNDAALVYGPINV